jgi:hypothetical protein
MGAPVCSNPELNGALLPEFIGKGENELGVAVGPSLLATHQHMPRSAEQQCPDLQQGGRSGGAPKGAGGFMPDAGSQPEMQR